MEAGRKLAVHEARCKVHIPHHCHLLPFKDHEIPHVRGYPSITCETQTAIIDCVRRAHHHRQILPTGYFTLIAVGRSLR
jgi:hypothetical protein